MEALLVVFLILVIHWYLSLFFQTVFLHRYCSHRMFELTPLMEKMFYLGTFIFQGSSYLNPSAYAIMHLEHHKYSDTESDPHSPTNFKSLIKMMLVTKQHYDALVSEVMNGHYRVKLHFESWKLIDRLGASWLMSAFWATFYTAIYYLIDPPLWAYSFLLIHWFMGPIQGAIVNWCGHKYGYQNFQNGDQSKNTLLWDIVLMGELFQNNHHKYPNQVNFATRWFEFDLGYIVLKIFRAFGLVRFF
jgi:stearoyl-CoA desaturase (delta-9 desaturase)